MSLHNRSINPESSSTPFEWCVPLSAPSYSEEEERAVAEAVRSGWWTYGPVAQQLEKEFAEYIGVRHAFAVASGTAALHLAYVALGLSPGDEVLLPSLNFVAGANTVLHAGGTPRFADVAALDALLVTSETLERCFTPRARGVCVMHYGGYPCEMEAIAEFARSHGLWLVEDAAHAPGAAWKGIRCGRWGDIACFSFFGNKNLTCAEGGMVVTERGDLADRLRLLRSHGMTSLTWDRYQGHSFSYDVKVPGFNYRLDDLRASILRVQLQALEHLNWLRRERSQWYREYLARDSRWLIPFECYNGISAHHLFVVVLAERVSRERVMRFLQERGVQTSIHYPPVHQFAFYRRLGLPPSDLSVTEALGRRLVTLPLFPDMTADQVRFVCESFTEAVDQAEC